MAKNTLADGVRPLLGAVFYLKIISDVEEGGKRG
jgi:hypothetical protein